MSHYQSLAQKLLTKLETQDSQVQFSAPLSNNKWNALVEAALGEDGNAKTAHKLLLTRR